MFTKGQIVKWKEGGKRTKLRIDDIDLSIPYEHKMSVSPIYFPGPRSRLKTRTVFSKIKIKIHVLEN